jgi:hypothetical protein
MAGEAASVYPTTGIPTPTLYIVTCTGVSAIDICDSTGSICFASWCYSGSCAGYALAFPGGSTPYCPLAGGGNPTWD